MSDQITLTPAERKLLGQLQRSAPNGQGYLVQAMRGRYALVAPSLRWGNPLVRFDSYNWSTIDGLRRFDLLTVADDWQPNLPQFEDPQRGDSTGGYAITLTDAGKQAAL